MFIIWSAVSLIIGKFYNICERGLLECLWYIIFFSSAEFLFHIHSLTKRVINVFEKLVFLIGLQFLEIGTNVSNYCHICRDFLARHSISVTKSLCEKCPNTEVFLVCIFPIWTECGNLQSKCPYSVWIRKDTDQKKLCIWTLFTQWIAWNRHWEVSIYPGKYDKSCCFFFFYLGACKLHFHHTSCQS